jgi:hypothetical protein
MHQTDCHTVGVRRPVTVLIAALMVVFGAIAVGVWNFADTVEPVRPVQLSP